MKSKKTFKITDKIVSSWKEFVNLMTSLDSKRVWIYRGQSDDWEPKTSLQRSVEKWGIELCKARGIEHQLIREFRRQYSGEDIDFIMRDTLYCLSVMQHHGAPTRLLDWTYSPFVATQFAIGEGSENGVMWCLNADWCNKCVGKIVGEERIKKRNSDKTRDDSSFNALFMKPKPKRFVFPENSFRLSERLVIQKGVFLCQGDINVSFLDNLTKMPDWHSEKNVLKIRFKMNPKNRWIASNELWRMNVTSATLFPGLDGFASSLKERVPNFKGFAERKIGL